MTLTPSASPDVAALQSQVRDYLEHPGHTQIHRVLRSNAAANAVAAVFAAHFEDRVAYVEDRVNAIATALSPVVDELWRVGKRHATGDISSALKLLEIWYFYSFTALRLTRNDINSRIGKFGGVYAEIAQSNRISQGDLGELPVSGSFDFGAQLDPNLDGTELDAELAVRREVAARLFVMLASTHQLSQHTNGVATPAPSDVAMEEKVAPLRADLSHAQTRLETHDSQIGHLLGEVEALKTAAASASLHDPGRGKGGRGKKE